MDSVQKAMHIHFTGSLKIVRKWAKGGAGLVCRLRLNNKHKSLCAGGERCKETTSLTFAEDLWLISIRSEMFLKDNYLYRSTFDFNHTQNQEQDVCVFDSHAGRWKIWMHGIFLATSFTLVALIMHTDKLLLDSDLLFQKAGGNVQHTLLIEWSSCTLMKWAGKILPFFFFSLTYYFVCVMCIFQHQRSSLGLKASPRLGTKQKVFLFAQVMDSFTWGKMKHFKGKGHPLSASQTDNKRSTSRVIADNCYSKETVPLATHPKNKRPHLRHIPH